MTIQNFNLTAGEWTDINTLASIAVGGNVYIKNLGRVSIRIIQQATQPLVPNVGDVITTDSKPYAIANITGGDRIWCYVPYECEIAVREIV